MSIAPTPSPSADPAHSPEERKEAANRVGRMFGSIAHRYDLLNHLLSFGTDYYWRWVAARELGGVLSRPGCRILDLCAGTGDLALVLKRRTPSEVVAADFCHPMLTIAREKFRRARLPIPTIEADALALPFASESFDLVALAFGFRNLVDHETALSEIRRVLKPGGEVAILEFSQVRGALFGPLFRFYFRFVLPKLGSLISGVRGPYQYLPESVSRFPERESLSRTMRECGFESVAHRDLTGGVVTLHRGTRPV